MASIIAISDNRIEATGKSCRDFADRHRRFGKSHVWYSRKFKNQDTFTITFDGRVFYFYRIIL